MADLERVDAVVIGANIRGLVTAYILSSLGYRAVLIEPSRQIGGADSSFVTESGTRFEHGLHVLDYERSEVATRLFSHVVDGSLHRVTLRRGIVLRNHVMPYAPLPSEMPDELRSMLPSEDLVDEIGDALPTRQRLAAHYGAKFADLVFDEVLASYPSEARHAAFGVDEAELLGNIHPWLFPRARFPESADESRAFHDLLRRGIEQQIIYPREGGFGGFAQGFIDKLDDERIEVLTGAADLDCEIEPGTHSVREIRAGGRRFGAPHVFWASGWARLCALLGIPCQDTASDRLHLGSFRFDRPALTEYHELLVGDPGLHFSRVYFPARFRESSDALVQVEFAIPEADDRPIDAEHWKARWLADLGRLGLIDDAHELLEFDYKTFRMHFNAYGMEGERLIDADTALIRGDSNIRPVIPSMANLNLNRYVPRVVRYVSAVLAVPAAEAGSMLPLAQPDS